MTTISRLTSAALLTGLFAVATTGCDSGPCSGGGMAVDSRELPAAWATSAPAPEGAVACHQADGSMDSEFERQFELGKSPQEGYDGFDKHLRGKGWIKNPAQEKDDTFMKAEYTHEGAKIELQVSRKVEDKGWCTLRFIPAK